MDTTTKPLEWAKLSDDKKENVRNFYSNLQLLLDFDSKANEKLFIFLYEERLGKHLWAKFREMKNMILFLKYLDEQNRAILLSNIYGYDSRVLKSSGHPLYANCY